MMCIFLAFGNGFYLISNVLPHTYARVANMEPRWMLLTDDVTAQLFNESEQCAIYSAARLPCPATGL